jgi:hypothetical protein
MYSHAVPTNRVSVTGNIGKQSAIWHRGKALKRLSAQGCRPLRLLGDVTPILLFLSFADERMKATNQDYSSHACEAEGIVW